MNRPNKDMVNIALVMLVLAGVFGCTVITVVTLNDDDSREHEQIIKADKIEVNDEPADKPPQ